MTTAHPRDPRLRRPGRSPLEAAVALEVAADAMRAGLRAPEPEPLDVPAVDPVVLEHVRAWDDAAELAAEAATEQGDEPEEFDDGPPAISPYDDEPEAVGPFVAGGQTVGQPAPPVHPAAPAPAIVVRDDETGEVARWTNGERTVLVPAPVFSSEHPPVGWRSRHDPRSLSFGVSRVLAGRGPLQNVLLPHGPILDQNTAGASERERSCCTGCATVAAANVLDARRGALTAAAQLEDAEAIYARAQQLDAVPGEDYPGTSVLAALQAAVERGLFGGYLWCFGTRDVAQTLIQKRLPVVVGVPWLSGMWETGPGGLVQLEGDDVGLGHCLTIVGLSLTGPQGQPGPYFVWQNSAGTGYGAGGLGYVHHRDLAELLRGVGEAAVPTLEPQAPQ